MRALGRPVVCLALVLTELVVLGGLVAHAVQRRLEHAPRDVSSRAMAQSLRLTSLSLWSEPRYCRHPAEADLFAPFGDHPGAIEHFPAGSIVPPPRVVAGEGEWR